MWLYKIAKQIKFQETWGDIAAALNYIADKAVWSLRRVSQLKHMPVSNDPNRQETKWFSMVYVGHKFTGNSLRPDYIVNVGMRWSGGFDDSYESSIGSPKLELTAQLHDENYEPMTEEEVFDTASDVAKFIKKNLDDNNRGLEVTEEIPPVLPEQLSPRSGPHQEKHQLVGV